MLRVAFLVHDLAANPIVRAAPLAAAIEDRCEVMIAGFLFSGDDVYAPYRGRFATHGVRSGRDLPEVIARTPALSRALRADVVVACKPLVTTLGVALWRRTSMGTPFVLDAEDDEWTPLGSTMPSILWRDVIKGWRHATAPKYTLAMHPATHLASGVTVATRALQRRYGGTIVRHGPDSAAFDPMRVDLGTREACRVAFGLPLGRSLALFAGTPQPHKGWPTLLDALQRPEAAAWDLVCAGTPDHPDFLTAREVLGARCHLVGLVPNESMPRLCRAVDAVPVPQRAVRFAEFQLPAKALEAMSMGVPVIGSRVGDMADLLGGGTRGWLVPPEDASALASAFAEIARNPVEASRRADAAREWVIAEASTRAIAERLWPIIEAAAR